MKKLVLIAIGCAALLLVGCGSDAGDVEAASKAAKAAPTSVDQLPDNMPPEARRSAAAAMAQGQAQKAKMDQQAEAMRKAREKMGN